jgi:hypothetical protein
MRAFSAHKVLELLGREFGMFAQRQRGDEDNPLMLRVMVDKPPDETREQWLARIARERGLSPPVVGPATGSAKGRDND